VLEVGCGPGRLSILLARGHGLDVTGLDLDPEMIRRARANAERAANIGGGGPTFLVGDVASLPFADRSLDLVVSTLSSHHWNDPTAGLDEIGRVLRTGGRALIWDLRPGVVPFHRDMPDPMPQVHASSLRVVSEMPWLWPWRFTLSRRIELVPSAESPTH
jgi:ubiquinone/menaquinone biosynthesis C-methylase UbiE